MRRADNGVLVFDSSKVLAVLRGDREALGTAMQWNTTPQGDEYWGDRAYGSQALTDGDRAFLRGLLTHEDRAAWDAGNATDKRAVDVAEAERAVIAAALAWRSDHRSELAANLLDAECSRLATLRGVA